MTKKHLADAEQRTRLMRPRQAHTEHGVAEHQGKEAAEARTYSRGAREPTGVGRGGYLPRRIQRGYKQGG